MHDIRGVLQHCLGSNFLEVVVVPRLKNMYEIDEVSYKSEQHDLQEINGCYLLMIWCVTFILIIVV